LGAERCNDEIRLEQDRGSASRAAKWIASVRSSGAFFSVFA
jgi:hypothetical protein